MPGVSGNPAVNQIKVFRPGIDAMLRATLRSASSEFLSEYEAKLLNTGDPSEALVGSPVDIFEVPTAFFNRSLSFVKFCVTRIVPA